MTISRKVLTAVKVKFFGGRGGDGCIAMLSLFANEMAGPCGGDGGNGGHVVLKANSRVVNFNNLDRVYRGQEGVRGRGKNMTGANAPHLFVDVPVGTIILPARPKELPKEEFDPTKSDIIAELDEEGSMFIAARGGSGGRGNAYFLSNSNRHPRIAQVGARGEVNYWELRLV